MISTVKGELLYSPEVSIDCVIFGFHKDELKVLLIKYLNTCHLALPGGFIRPLETIDSAASRILESSTGVGNVYLEQFGVFGQPDRMDKKAIEEVISGLYLSTESPIADHMQKRFISIGYYALVDFTQVKLIVGQYYSETSWYDLSSVPHLIHDHNLILTKALESLRNNLENKAVGKNLMPDKFTMKELQNLHEVILGIKLVRTNFQRRMLNMNILKRVDKKYTGKAHKAPYLYKFKKKEG